MLSDTPDYNRKKIWRPKLFILVRRKDIDGQRWFVQVCEEDENYFYETNDPSQATVFTFGQAESYRRGLDDMYHFRTDPRYQWVERFEKQRKSDLNTTPFWLSKEEKEEHKEKEKPKWRGFKEIASQQKEDDKKAEEVPSRSPNPFAAVTLGTSQETDESEVQQGLDNSSNPFRKAPDKPSEEVKKSPNPFL